MKAPFLKTPYNYDTNAASNESGLVCLEPTRTQQHFKDECDINYVLKNFGIEALAVNPLEPRYGDFTDVVDYHTALNAVIAAEDAFMALPAKIRTRFENDPSKLIDFMQNPANREEAESLGLVNKTEPVPIGLLDPIGTGDTKTTKTTKSEE
ncbi:MAG: internal scaffolding protein [Arizlama microvirus]|nr:MAG: internal scaffolding protein [Arizlama microvirus]